MRFLPAAVLLTLAGCSARAPLVADYGPEKRFALVKGDWIRNAKLEKRSGGAGHYSELESGEAAAIVAGDHDVLRFGRDDDDRNIRIWVELDAGKVVTAVLWAREWDGETVWFTGDGGSGTSTVTSSDGGTIEGSIDLRWDGKRETARGGPAGPFVFRLQGDFQADLAEPE